MNTVCNGLMYVAHISVHIDSWDWTRKAMVMGTVKWKFTMGSDYGN